ncbi:hypothetical protein A9Q97_04130 [Rhodospirillales bacterium 47_12_T64]|nr:hypothetical protein A9Q97_04130 [Rhodospirillales bacterium 47_12_T64]
MSRPGERGDRSIALFLLALLLFSPLILSIFSQEEFLFGLPLLYIYLFTAWGAIIAAVAWSAWRERDKSGGHEQGKTSEISYGGTHDSSLMMSSVKNKEDALLPETNRSKNVEANNVKGDNDAG